MTPDRWQQIEQLFHAALEREPAQRAAFLRDACAADDGLRREVESLLAQEQSVPVTQTPALVVGKSQFVWLRYRMGNGHAK